MFVDDDAAAKVPAAEAFGVEEGHCEFDYSPGVRKIVRSARRESFGGAISRLVNAQITRGQGGGAIVTDLVYLGHW